MSSPARGDVAFHEGYLTTKEARRLAKSGEGGEAISKPSRPEVTSGQQDYIDLHRHAAVRARMIGQPGLCLRVAVAHMIAGSPLWTIRTEPQRAADAIVESVENSPSEAQFDERGIISAMIGLSRNLGLVTGASVMGTVFAYGTSTKKAGAAGPDAIATGMHLAFAVAASLVMSAVLLSIVERRRV